MELNFLTNKLTLSPSWYTFVHMSSRKQLHLIKPSSLSYGGELLKTRKGRSQGRPIDTKATMHLVLRSSQAKGAFSFRRKKNELAISNIVAKFSAKFGIEVLSLANVGNHLHFHIRIKRRRAYYGFIRAITSAIRMAIVGSPRWGGALIEGKFWDERPFSRVIRGRRAFLTLQGYVFINQLEGKGVSRSHARTFINHVDSLRESLLKGGTWRTLSPPV